MQRQWRIIPHDSGRVESLIQAAGLPPVVAQLLVSRGVYTAEEASQFLDTKLMGLRILSRILLGTQAAPLRKTLLDSGLGEDVLSGGLYAGLRQMVFSVGMPSTRLPRMASAAQSRASSGIS